MGYVKIPMGNASNFIFLEFSLAAGSPNNYALAYGLANDIVDGVRSVERVLTNDYTKKDRGMKYPSQKNLIIKLHESKLLGSGLNATGNFVIQQGSSDFINIAIRDPLLMKRTFVHEFIHFFNRDVIDGNTSLALSETLTVLFEGKCVPDKERVYRFCGSSDLYDAITSKGVVDQKKLASVVSEALLANNDYLGHEYKIAELLGQVMMEKLAVEMPRASVNKRMIEATKRIISIQKDFSRIMPTHIKDDEIIFSEKPKALDTIAKKLGFSGGFSDMVSSINGYYEKNVYAEAKQVASFKRLMQEFAAMDAEETQLEIPPPKAAKKLAVVPQSQNPPRLSAIPQRDIAKIFPELRVDSPVPRMTRAQHQAAMNEWVTAIKNKQTIPTPKVGIIRGIAGTVLQGIGYAPMPSEVIDAFTPSITNQAYIDMHGDDIKNAEAGISILNEKIVALEAERDAIPRISSRPAGVSMKGDNSREMQKRSNALKVQIDVLYKNRDGLMDKVAWLQSRIQDKKAKQIKDEYDAMLGKQKYVPVPLLRPVY